MDSPIVNIVSLVIFTTMLAVGQLLFKQAALSMRGMPLVEGLLGLASLPVFYAALALYGLSTLLWVWILSRIPLMQAYPWVASAVIIVPFLSGYVFGEKASPVFWLGAALIAAGIFLTQYAINR